jgi:hypothetical protein
MHHLCYSLAQIAPSVNMIPHDRVTFLVHIVLYNEFAKQKGSDT